MMPGMSATNSSCPFLSGSHVDRYVVAVNVYLLGHLTQTSQT